MALIMGKKEGMIIKRPHSDESRLGCAANLVRSSYKHLLNNAESFAHKISKKLLFVKINHKR